MTTLTIDQIEMAAAEIGPENPLPYFRDPYPSAKVGVDESVPESDRKYLGWETSFRVLPHRMQDSYSRDKLPRKFTAAILENEHLRAVVLPEIGGRLISIVHKPTATELLEPVTHFQPTNIALRNAWIAGGVEWNTAQLGHHYLTCSPMFAARVTGAQGEPVLRLYAWERTKRFPYQIDFHLPPGSEFLFVRPRVINPHDSEMPMYWWSNIAVPQAPDRRVLAPADTAISNTPNGLGLVNVPFVDGCDRSYATNIPFAKEFFFRIAESDRPWVASLDGRGMGLIHSSTARLRGRKMFVWGTSRGGQRWQERLLGPGRAYLEIQGGLARTQIESIPMPANTQWAWTEAFGLMQADTAKAHSTDWSEARSSVGAALEEMLPWAALNQMDSDLAEVTAKAPDQMLFAGDGWGSLELIRDGRGAMPAMPWAKELVGADQEQWLALLRDGALPERDIDEEPGCYMVQPEWRELLEESVKRGASDHWLGWLHLGVMRLEALDPDGAREAWMRSIERRPSGWAYRNLSVLQTRDGSPEAACDLMRLAWEAGPKAISLALEYVDLLEKTARWDELREFVAGLSESMRGHERMLIVSAKLALHYDDLRGVEQILSHEFATIREGEVTLTDLWFAWQAKLVSEREGIPVNDELLARVRRELTPPLEIDQRMAGEKS